MNEVITNAKQGMEKAIQSLNHELNSIRAGRANPAILDKVLVDYYGTPTPIEQMAAISVAENRILVIQPWDKSVLGEIERAIHMSDIGINPNNDGEVIRIVFPQPTEERRKDICKDVRRIAEESKVAIRNVRREANDELKKIEDEGQVSEDAVHRMEKEVQDVTDEFVSRIDDIADAKEKEVLEI